MKILQLNIWGGRLGQQIIDLIDKEKPDIACLQEVIHINGQSGSFFTSLDTIKEKTGYAHSDFSPSYGFNVMRRKAQFGLAILSRIPFAKTDHISTGLEYEDDFDVIDSDYNIRTLQLATIENNGNQLHVINHHGYHIPGHKDGNEVTMRQCRMIVELVERLRGNVVVCGDFNLRPESESVELINSKLTNLVKEHSITTTRTHLTHKNEACDFVFVDRDIEVRKFAVLDDIVSDHKALVVEF